jgi:uncharacterized membrane protein
MKHTIEKKDTKKIKQLVKLMRLRHRLPEQKIIQYTVGLQEQAKLGFNGKAKILCMKLKEHLLSSQSLWYWVTIALALATMTLVLIVPENLFPFVYVRNILGFVFVLVLPGFTLIKILFPKKDLDTIERTALSIGMSFALVSITALLLSYTPWGVSSTPITFSLLALTVSFATAAVIRDYVIKVRIIAEK